MSSLLELQLRHALVGSKRKATVRTRELPPDPRRLNARTLSEITHSFRTIATSDALAFSTSRSSSARS